MTDTIDRLERRRAEAYERACLERERHEALERERAAHLDAAPILALYERGVLTVADLTMKLVEVVASYLPERGDGR